MVTEMTEAQREIKLYELKPDVYIYLPIVMFILVLISLLLRVYTRAILIKAFGLDDWLLLLAFVLYVGDISTLIKGGLVVKEHGLVKPLLEVAAYDFASMLIYLANQIVLKFSMALFFLRIPQRPWQLWSIKISVVVYAIYSFAFFFVVLFECGSPRGFNFVYGHCFHWNIMGPMNYIAASLNAIVDWVFVLTPLVVVSQTMMDRKHKIQVCLLILLGAFGSVISVARIPLISELRIIPSLTYFGRIVPIVALSAVETSVGLICISLAALRPLVQKTRRNKSTVRSNGSMGNLQHNTGRSGRSRGHIPAGSAFDGKHYELKAGAFHVIEEGDVPLCREEV